MNVTRRDMRVWINRMGECRNPAIWASALNYDWQRLDWLGLATGRPKDVLQKYLREIEDDQSFIQEISLRLAKWTSYKPRAIDFMMFNRAGSVFFNEVTLYAVVRLIQPEVVVETGGTPGKSTAFILRAMERNKVGHLYTIDFPPQNIDDPALTRRQSWHQAIPQGLGSNWVVPDNLRARHTLLLGKSSEHLPELLARLKQIDIFLHDSDHSYQNMTWEFETSWPAIRPGGLLLSDDVLDNTSFFDFCRQRNARYRNVFNLGVACKI